MVPEEQCYQPSCANLSRPSYRRDCREVFDEECEVILEPGSRDQCTTVEQVEYSEQCSTVYTQECVTVQEKVCREPDLQPPGDGYGVPQVSPSVENNVVMSNQPNDVACGRNIGSNN